MKKKFPLISAIILSLILFSVSPSTPEEILESDTIFSIIQKTHIINRDAAAASQINSIIRFTAKVEATDQADRYNRKFRVIASDSNSAKHRLNIKYLIFIDSRNIWSQIEAGEQYIFTGLITAYTPLNTSRDSYIFDILYSSIEIIVE